MADTGSQQQEEYNKAGKATKRPEFEVSLDSGFGEQHSGMIDALGTEAARCGMLSNLESNRLLLYTHPLWYMLMTGIACAIYAPSERGQAADARA